MSPNLLPKGNIFSFFPPAIPRKPVHESQFLAANPSQNFLAATLWNFTEQPACRVNNRLKNARFSFSLAIL